MNDAIPSKENPFVLAGAIFSALLILSIPLSTAVAGVLTILLLLCWLLSAQYRDLPRLLRANRVAASALSVFALFVVGAFYGDATSDSAWSMVHKYRKIGLILILLPFMGEEKYRRWILLGFVATSVVSLVGSYLMEMEILPMNRYGTATFKSRITHNLFMAFFGYYCSYRFCFHTQRRWLWLGLFFLTVFDLFFVVEGRTGQVVFALLMVLLFFQRFELTRAFILVPILLAILVGVVLFSGAGARFEEGIDNSIDFFKGRENLDTSMGQRLYFWQNSIDLIVKRPIFGYGTGSYVQEFKHITGDAELLSENPHNEYLMIAVQLGGLGLFAYLLFLGSQWRSLADLPGEQRWFAQAVLLSLVVNSALNTTFMDHSEGHWYACLIAFSFATISKRRPAQ